jgi:hypothetical protein
MPPLHDNPLRHMVVAAVVIALGLALPPVFHLAGLGSKFLPMLLPLLLGGFLLPLRWALLAGAVTPWISALLTGMPPLYPPVAALMSVEGAVLGGAAAAVYRRGRGNLWAALAAAVVLGRASAAALSWLAASWFHLPPLLTGVAVILQGLPGTVLQLVLVPLLMRSLAARKGLLFHEPGRQA